MYSPMTWGRNIACLAVACWLLYANPQYREKMREGKEKPLLQLLFGVGLTVLTVSTATILMRLLFPDAPFGLFRVLNLSAGELGQFLLRLAIGVSWEELFFRGYLLQALRRSLQSDWWAIFFSALLFSLGYIPGRQSVPIMIVYTGVHGALYAVCIIKSKYCSIYSLILAHFLHNFAVSGGWR